ncbi:hypothetical protein [Paenibacillus sp. FSL H7-0331]|uniref:putative amidoligase domain-containing protein n=1 Tax=Paenibacillus sp. FSL H7-0331 TaxID=1920421 RepID=UPI00096E940F|nr:hypothetical protein [Paenibacillus sp. FSL H7-0331]OMF19869.1 hypothetical protein BK127_02900 [Paenibacillus sp. FSL H7-0331]
MRVWLLHSNEPTLPLLLDRLQVPNGTRLPVQLESTCIIHWGCFQPQRQEQLTLQPVKSQLRAAKPEKASALLKLHGIQSNWKSEGQRFSYEYRIPVFHLQALSVFQKQSAVFYGTQLPPSLPKSEEGGFEELSIETLSYHAVRSKREAVKALYALGLDYGVVHIGVRPGGELVVLEIQAAPQLTERLAELFADAIHQFAEELDASYIGKEVALLGADPEFLLRDMRGKVTFASKFLTKDGPVGCDAIVLPSFRKIYPLAELRPEPSVEVDQLANQLYRTMQMASRKISDDTLEWVAGGMPVQGFPLGGHLHFSGVWLNVELLRTLDNYLALPLTLIEAPTTGRRKPKYGFLGDYRKQRHGGFEYRVLPSWLISPKVTKGVFALAKLIADHYRLLPSRPLQDVSVQEAYYTGDKLAIRPLLPALWNDLVRLPTYRKYERWLVPLKAMLLKMDAWDEQQDIRRKWQIGPYHRKEESSVHS